MQHKGRSIRVGAVTTNAGEKQKGFINVGQSSCGSIVKVPVIILNGAKPGPRLWIQACNHGDEPNGTFAILKVLGEINLEDLAGAVIALPALNITAFRTGQRTSPMDNLDLNRLFPGKEVGSFSQQVAKVIFENVVANADYLIDIHSGGKDSLVTTHAIFYGSFTEDLEKLTKAVGFRIICGLKGKELAGTLIAVATARGIPSIIIEAGGGGRIEDETKEAVVQAIMNLMKHLGMIKGEAKMNETCTVLSDMAIIRSKYGGLFESKVGLTSHVSKGTVLAEVRNVFAEKIADVRSTVDGIVVAKRVFPTVSSGDMIFEIAHDQVK
jgi:predicted deacylase